MAAHWPCFAALYATLRGTEDFPDPAGPTSSALVPRRRPPPSNTSSCSEPPANDLLREASQMVGRKQSWKDLQSASSNGVIVITAPKFNPAHLRHAQPSPLRAIIERQLLQSDDTVHDAVELKIAALRRHVVDHQHRRVPRPQEVLQRENLSPITQRVLRQQPHLGKRVDDDARRVDALDLTAQQTHRLAKLDFRSAEHCLPIVVALCDRAAPARKSRCRRVTSHGRPRRPATR